MIRCVFNFLNFQLKIIKIQAINVIESPRLKKIFLLLRQELKESDIPGRTTMTKKIEEAFQDRLKMLEEEMAV
jgi:hypothetical protein